MVFGFPEFGKVPTRWSGMLLIVMNLVLDGRSTDSEYILLIPRSILQSEGLRLIVMTFLKPKIFGKTWPKVTFWVFFLPKFQGILNALGKNTHDNFFPFLSFFSQSTSFFVFSPFFRGKHNVYRFDVCKDVCATFRQFWEINVSPNHLQYGIFTTSCHSRNGRIASLNFMVASI